MNWDAFAEKLAKISGSLGKLAPAATPALVVVLEQLLAAKSKMKSASQKKSADVVAGLIKALYAGELTPDNVKTFDVGRKGNTVTIKFTVSKEAAKHFTKTKSPKKKKSAVTIPVEPPPKES